MTRRIHATRPLLALPLIVAATVAAASCGESEERGREVPMREQPELDVEIVGPGTVSTEAPEFAASFTPDGDTLYFGRASEDRSSLRILRSIRGSDGWGEPEVASFSGTHRDVDPFVSPDGSRLYFSSDRPAPVGAGGYNTWWIEREGDGAGEPRTAGPPLNSPAPDVFVSATREGTVFFSSRRSGRQQIYRTRPTDDRWAAPELLSFGSVVSAGNPLVDPEGRFVVLTSLGPGGSPDLFLSCRTEEGWGEPEPLPNGINSDHPDFAPGLHPDGTLLFTSERPGVVEAAPDSGRAPGDLYRSDFRPGERCG